MMVIRKISLITTLLFWYNILEGNIRVVGEMDEFGLLHIFNEEQLEHYGK